LLQVTVAERAAVEPPRLGKHRFEAAPLAVLTSEEVTGSLRELKVRMQEECCWVSFAGQTGRPAYRCCVLA
jgi:hypothetical protein